MGNPVVDPQPLPRPGSIAIKEIIQSLSPLETPPERMNVLRDVLARGEASAEKYGSPLMANNGRDADVDEYQELDDAIAYKIQGIVEEENFQEAISRMEELHMLLEVAIRTRKRLVRRGVLPETNSSLEEK